jgi:hypothetical protein
MKSMSRLLKQGKFLLDYYLTARRSTIILSAGMPRSGSTWLFNAARLLLQSCGDLGSGWIGDFATLPKKPLLLLKVHDYSSLLARHAQIVLYSFRDIRDALASSKRKFGTAPTIELARRWIEQDRRWRARADFILRYESMMADPETAIQQLARTLQCPLKNPHAILQQVQQLSTAQPDGTNSSYNKATLLHPGHITDGRHGSWEEWLDPELVQRIEKEFAGWLSDNEYPTGTMQQAGTS